LLVEPTYTTKSDERQGQGRAGLDAYSPV